MWPGSKEAEADGSQALPHNARRNARWQPLLAPPPHAAGWLQLPPLLPADRQHRRCRRRHKEQRACPQHPALRRRG